MSMSQLKELMGGQSVGCGGVITSGRWTLDVEADFALSVAPEQHAELLIYRPLRNAKGAICVERGATLDVVHVVSEANQSALDITLAEGALCRVTEVVAAPSDVQITANLVGCGARYEQRGVFVLTDEEKGRVKVNVRHLVSDCTSSTLVKGVASGAARGSFEGMVYVAPDAQRTDAEQTSRNVVIGTAHIDTQPQLEIYADDVKCSHGATVGQMDAEAIYYMRQRGISLSEAKRLQIEGFVSDVVMHSTIERLVEPLQDILTAKFSQL